ncbi:pyrimidine and pyridine-specific 5'-nucleotidase [Pancytospora epiphaga]|nr:pyrimidine and pyridine-specific 5'-nucleotidase [Pancytospora epiphaga]
MATVYIEMSSRNKNVPIQNPVGSEKILVFDIDYCLFHNPEQKTCEIGTIKNIFMEKSSQDNDAWHRYFTLTDTLFKEVFFKLFDIHPAEFTTKYEELGLPDYVKIDNELVELLKKSHYRMFCFTNSGRGRASKILKHMGIEELFEAVICTDSVDTEFICKPKQESYDFLVDVLGITDRKNVHFFDDTNHNVVGAIDAGLSAYLVNGDLKLLLSEHIK